MFIDLWRGHYLSAVLDGGVVPLVGSAANALKLTRFGAKAWSRLAAASRVASAVKRLRDFKQTLALAAQSGTLRSRASYYAYDFVFCKVLRLACFTAGTPVECEFGSVAIEDITPGTRVWSRGEFDAEGAVELKVVEEVFERYASVMRVKLAGGVEFGTTHEHPFWVVGKGWVVARELAAGDKLVGRDGGEVAVEGVSETGEWARVYNFRVADHHTYFVGGQEWGCSVWTHNLTCTIVNDSGKNMLVIHDLSGLSKLEIGQLRRFVKAWNEEIAKAGGSLVRKAPTAAENALAKTWREAMKAKFPSRFRDRFVGHVPDAVMGGQAANGRAMALTGSLNSRIGGLAHGIAEGTRYHGVHVTSLVPAFH